MGLRKTLVFLLLIAQPTLSFACQDAVAQLRGDWGRVDIHVEVADSVKDRAQGLMFVENLPARSGMLFVYERPQPVAFWMRNTLIPLDMLFFDQHGQLSRLHENAQPLDETSIPGGQAVQYVLEVPGGTASQYGWGPGTQLRHPAIDQNIAVWMCD